ncbi:MPN337 family protein [Mycoplasma bradburyae]|uniref:MPN337 family protein n=1 Tax=Mycoplasma bradburyae TaxID=2963128 RepID=UPI00234164F1|nr:hypothetical protein [Mycoplasma bradburyae]MDC4184441.1 hypothetical protein [Mycoplasma bradburyae]
MDLIKKNKDKNSFNLDIKNIVNFNIQKINKSFLDSNLFNASSQKISKNNYKLLKANNEDFFDVQSLLNEESIGDIINFSLKKINSIIGTNNLNHFDVIRHDEYGEAFYVNITNINNDFEIEANQSQDLRFVFELYVKDYSYLNQYCDKIQINLMFDEINKIISGNFVFFKQAIEVNFEDFIKNVYRNYFIKNFIKEHFMENSLRSQVRLFEDLSINKQDDSIYLSSKFKNQFVSTIKSLDENNDLGVDHEEFFYAINILNMIILMIYEDLKAFFQSNKPISFLDFIQRKTNLSNVKTNAHAELDFLNLFNYVNSKYFFNHELDLQQEDVDNLEDALDLINEFYDLYQFEEKSLSDQILNFELSLSDKKLDKYETIVLLLMYPEIFGLDNKNYINTKFDQLLSSVSNFKISDQVDYQKKHDLVLCELNQNYECFINQNKDFLIIKSYFENLNLFEIYNWALIYENLYEAKYLSISNKFYKLKNTQPQIMRELLNELNQLKYYTIKQIYGLGNIEVVINKLLKYNDFNDTINQFIKTINRDDQMYGKSKERKYLLLGIITAFLFGLMDFLTTIFSILPVTQENVEVSIKNIPSLIVIGAGSLLATILLIILTISFFKRHSSRSNKTGH